MVYVWSTQNQLDVVSNIWFPLGLTFIFIQIRFIFGTFLLELSITGSASRIGKIVQKREKLKLKEPIETLNLKVHNVKIR